MTERDLANQVDELLSAESGLTAWEMEFLENMDGRTSFSDAQADKIKQIWDRVLG